MSIAVLGWGSLIWCPGNLRIKTAWRPNGPMLPIEFARISQDDRLTLVIQPGSPDQPTYWALSEFTAIEDARDNLRAREKTNSSYIHHIRRDGRNSDGVSQEVVTTITQWLNQHTDIEAVLWTGLPSNWRRRRAREFTPEDAIAFLSELEANRDQAKATYERAREYVTNAPPLINTAVRRAMRERGWEDTRLPTILFETSPSRPSVEPG